MTPNALYFGPGCPDTGVPCRIDVLPMQLSMGFSESAVETVPFDHLTVKSGGFDQDHLVLRWTTDGQAREVYVREPALIHAMTMSAHAEVGGPIRRAVARAGRARRLAQAWIWAAVALVIAAFVGLWMASDLVVRLVVNRIPVEWEQTLGESARRELLTGQPTVIEGPAVTAVQKMTRRLTDQLGPDIPYQFTVTVVHNDTVNAMALPGGSVIVYTGLLKQADSPEEVAGVLAHELSHVVLRHGMESMVQSVGLMTIAMVVLGNQQGVIGSLERLGVQITTLKFSREKETAADLYGLHLLEEAQISPAGMIAFFERLAKNEGTPIALLSTHPMSTERAARLNKEASSLPMASPVPFDVDWTAVKASL